MTVDIKDKLYRDISNYCRANHLVIKDYINDLLKKEFMIDKYGDRPGVAQKEPVKEVPVIESVETTPKTTEPVVIEQVVEEPVIENEVIEEKVEKQEEVINTEIEKQEEPVVKQTRKRKLK